MPHLNDQDRFKLELMIKSGHKINEIANELKKVTSTISREIKKHSVESDKVVYGRIPNCCVHRKNCKRKYQCSKHFKSCKKSYCSLCKYCNEVCPDYIEEKCSKLSSSPHVCYTEEKTIPKHQNNQLSMPVPPYYFGIVLDTLQPI